MKRIFAVLAIVVLSLGLMGSMGVAAQENATANETDSDELSGTIESIVENIDPETAPDQYVETVREWSDGRLEDLPRADREKVRSWLEEASGDRDDGGNESDGDRGDDELDNATVESDELGDLAAADTLEHSETVRFSDAHRIVGWEFDDDRVQVAVAMNISGTVEISDALAGAGEEGAIQVPKTSHDLERGIHVLTFPVETVQGGSAVGVSVDGDTVRLSSALEEQNEADPFATFGGESGLFTGVLMTVILATAAAWWVIRSENSGVIEA